MSNDGTAGIAYWTAPIPEYVAAGLVIGNVTEDTCPGRTEDQRRDRRDGRGRGRLSPSTRSPA